MSRLEAEFVIPAIEGVSVAVRGKTARFPVRRIYCVGRNYAEHTREMGHDPDRELPFFFQKNPDNLVLDNGDFPYPSVSSNVHFEVEMVVAIGTGGTDIPLEKALNHVYGYALGLDMTRRDLQGEAKKQGRPWEVGKAFDASAPISPIRQVAATGIVTAARIWLKVNGATRQDSDVSKLIWNVNETIEHLSRYFELQAGDLIYTGTPEGVAAVQPGDLMEGGVDGVGTLRLRVGAA
jgi:fumarylpyruvate hydrolase